MKLVRRGKQVSDGALPVLQNQLPEWLRKPLADWILESMKHAENQSEQQLLRRLTTDWRMKTVWAEIYKKRGPAHFNKTTVGPDLRPYFNKAVIWPATRAIADVEEDIKHRVKLALKYAEHHGYLPDMESGRSEQDEAAVLFLECAFKSGLNTEPTTYSELQQYIRDYEYLAKEERITASRLTPTKARAAAELAEIFEMHAEYQRSADVLQDPTIISRGRGDVRVRTLVLRLLMITNSIFRKDMLNTVGTIAAVMLDKEKISRSRLRGIVRFSALTP